MSELEDRRQRAREAAHDMPIGSGPQRIDAAIETATRVQITPEMLAEARHAWSEAEGSWVDDPGPREIARAKALLRAAGFEVVE